MKLFKGKRAFKAGQTLPFSETLKALLAQATQRHQLEMQQLLQLGLKDLGVPDGTKIHADVAQQCFVVKE